MKTSGEQARSKLKKPSSGEKSAKGKKTTILKSGPTEEEIRQKAEEIYYERMSRGEYRTAEDDWLEAEELLRKIKE